VNSSYRPCGSSLIDALSLYDRVRETYGSASPVCTLGQSAGGHLALMVAAFGEENLPSYSPVQVADPGLKGVRILAVTAAEDPLISYSQMTLLRDVMHEDDPAAYVATMQLAGGDRPFVHAYVSQAALDAYHQAEQDLVAAFEASPQTERTSARLTRGGPDAQRG